jgi:hypothetical protein
VRAALALLTACPGCGLFHSEITPAGLPVGVDLGLFGETPGGLTGYAVAAGDLLGDDAPELLLLAAEEPAKGDQGLISVWAGPWRGIVDVEEQAPVLLTTRQRLSAVAAADVTGDGQDDLVAAGCDVDGAGSLLLVERGPIARGVRAIEEADGRWTRPDLDCSDPSMVSLGDWDGDGGADLLMEVHSAEGTLSYTISAGPLDTTGELSDFPTQIDLLFREEPHQPSAAGDLDGDGQRDLVLSAPSASASWVFLHVPRGAESAKDAEVGLYGEPGTQSGAALAVADLDGDGQDDLAIGAPSLTEEQGLVSVWFGPLTGDRPPDFRAFESASGGFGAHLQPIDLLQDGQVELATFTGPALAYLGDGEGYSVQGPASPWFLLEADGSVLEHDLSVDPLPGHAGWEADGLGLRGSVVADFDADGEPDLVAGAMHSAVVGAAYLWWGAELP